MVVTPEVVAGFFTGASENFWVMRNQYRLVPLIEQFSQGQHPGLQLRQSDVVVCLVNKHDIGGTGRQGSTNHVKSDERLFTVRKLVKENQNGHYFEDGNENSLWEVLDKMLGDLPSTKKMGIESERIIREEVNIHTVLKKYVETFEYVVKK